MQIDSCMSPDKLQSHLHLMKVEVVGVMCGVSGACGGALSGLRFFFFPPNGPCFVPPGRLSEMVRPVLGITKFPRLGSLSGSLLVPNSVGWGVFLGSSASVSKGTVVPRSTEQRWDVFRPPEPAYSYGRGVFAWLERLSITRRWNPSAHFFSPTKLRPQLAAPNLPLPELRDPLFLPLSTNASWINGLHMRQWIPCTLHTTLQIQQWT